MGHARPSHLGGFTCDRSLSESLQNLTGVIFWFYLFKDFFDLAFLIDQKSGSVNAHVRSSHKLLLSPNAVAFGDRMIGVGQQGERKFVFGLELLVRLFAVG